VAFSPDGQTILTGSFDKTARIWDAATGNELRRFEGHADWVSSVAFSPDGRYVLTGSYDNTARLWDADSGKQVRAFHGHLDQVTSAVFSPDGRYVLTGSLDGTARLWESKTGKEVAALIGFKDGSWAVVDPQGRFDTDKIEGNIALHWVIDGDQMRVSPLAAFKDRFYTPGLLKRILGGEKLPSVQ